MNWSQVVLQQVEQKEDSFPQDLIEFSEKVEQEKLKHLSDNLDKKSRFFGDGFYASPIIALNRRDLQALADFFNRDDMEAIDLDLRQLLERLLPDFYTQSIHFEHGGHGDPALDFLQEYL